ncbi:MAG: hypothetical protein ACD_30C00112G0038 [uncultured bacterium]|uniref:Type IV pilus modification protein PilV n=4 Tax=Candidatus Daviesiibacteriota TaxID=1752718 RepID=A0A0G0EYD7_9BACT|nr:MAG: hypothetical protein ACD_30C00112G0038 [uncultured bacterium]KKQ10542.1 MAG: Type IV pilus modification protein PilV [Candidatus Daviesbacteria bacterium GW2011_GWB1_36_5]KKQ15285.1 MAG: Type IV pilus modification protein PilV [Candidatus Daviesbacteria bacterium GW2011_GWA1_36_8]OGE17197.1 MAG: hypothetical protein A2858_00640 [Candidatus Daviesbacteria bacterium RIFCSPHIGHO2_01_FULL_36_37]OGE35978.1 MAG: hypothetical protein A3E66_01635 [Candidatus Daviesbacteria bacterium RIFCSPHIGHO
MTINQKGQSILEITIALGLILIVVSGIAVATLNGLRNSQFSRNQLQATKYAQEMLEGVRATRERDYTVCGPAPIIKWSDLWSSNACTPTLSCNFILQTSGTCPDNAKADPFWLSPTLNPAQITFSGTVFTRIINIQDYQANLNQKLVTATVSWQDASGSHKSELTTILAEVR